MNSGGVATEMGKLASFIGKTTVGGSEVFRFKRDETTAKMAYNASRTGEGVTPLELVSIETAGLGGKGGMRALLTDLLRAADEAGVAVFLDAGNLDGIPTSKTLVGIYEKFGFRVVRRRHAADGAETGSPDHAVGVEAKLNHRPGACCRRSPWCVSQLRASQNATVRDTVAHDQFGIPMIRIKG